MTGVTFNKRPLISAVSIHTIHSGMLIYADYPPLASCETAEISRGKWLLGTVNRQTWNKIFEKNSFGMD